MGNGGISPGSDPAIRDIKGLISIRGKPTQPTRCPPIKGTLSVCSSTVGVGERCAQPHIRMEGNIKPSWGDALTTGEGGDTPYAVGHRNGVLLVSALFGIP